MRDGFPEPPKFGFSWRNLLVEPVPFSGERISLAAIVKADDGALLVPKFVARRKLRDLFGAKMGNHIADALDICVDCAEGHFKRNPIYLDWKPPMESFHVGKSEYSFATDLEEAILVVGQYCSSISVVEQAERKSSSETQKNPPLHKQWETEIKANVGMRHSAFKQLFDSKISLKKGGVELKVGFLSDKYAAQFEAVASASAVQSALLRAQAKLWQLDLLRDDKKLLKDPYCELLLGLPPSSQENDGKSKALTEFVHELEFEASRRDLGIFTATSPSDAAMHVIEKAA